MGIQSYPSTFLWLYTLLLYKELLKTACCSCFIKVNSPDPSNFLPIRCNYISRWKPGKKIKNGPHRSRREFLQACWQVLRQRKPIKTVGYGDSPVFKAVVCTNSFCCSLLTDSFNLQFAGAWAVAREYSAALTGHRRRKSWTPRSQRHHSNIRNTAKI